MAFKEYIFTIVPKDDIYGQDKDIMRKGNLEEIFIELQEQGFKVVDYSDASGSL